MAATVFVRELQPIDFFYSDKYVLEVLSFFVTGISSEDPGALYAADRQASWPAAERTVSSERKSDNAATEAVLMQTKRLIRAGFLSSIVK